MNYKVLIFFLVTLSLSCSKVENDTTRLISHAGDGLTNIATTNATNSKEAIDFVLSLKGCDGVELDVQLSQDGELWLFHDFNMFDHTGIDACINQLTYQDLKDVTYKTLNHEKLVRLSDVDFSQYHGKDFYFDIKQFNPCDGVGVDLDQLITAFQELDLPADNNYFHMTLFKNWVEPFIAAGFKTFYISTIEDVNSMIDTPGLYGVQIKHSLIGDFDISIWQQKVVVGVYDLRSAKTVRETLRMNPDFLETDNIQIAINIKK